MEQQRKFHPVANVFKLLEGAEFDALVESIKRQGLLNPITLHPDGSIADGRNRYRACIAAGVEPRFVTWDGEGSLADFVVGQNLDRRQMSATEKALVGKELEPLYAAEAKERQRLGQGRPKKGEKRVTQVKEREPQARDLAAKAARTNPVYISDLKRIEREAPEIFARLKAGELELPEAKRLLHKAHVEQRLKAAAKLPRPATDLVDLRVSSMEALLAKIRNVDCIMTEPPNDAVPRFGELARLAKTALKPDGILCVICRQNHLPQIMDGMTKHISYRWMIACLTGAQTVQVWNRKANSFWKPIVIFGGQPRKWIDVLRRESDFDRLIEHLTERDALVCDPFLGAGDIAAACVRLTRRVVGCDTDADMVKTAKSRVALALAERVQ
jgi:hypothetical protein